jgi:5-methylcytosine-specific restriction protein A
MASGMVVSAPAERPHWNPQKADTLVWKVEVDFDAVLEPVPGSLLPRELLETGGLRHVDWSHQRSGISIPAESAAELETLWADWLDKRRTIGQKIRVYFDSLEPGEIYGRPELATLWGYKDWHAIGRGIVTPVGHKSIILFVTKEKQEALTQYEDHFDGDLLHMQGETNHAADQRLVNAASAGDAIHLFYRDQHHTDFTYYGEVSLREQDLRETEPSRFVFTTSKLEADSASAIASELRAHGGFEDDFVGDAEGRRVLRLHVTYERSPRNRARALEIHGTKCTVCGFDFNQFYGADLARDYIEVHHTRSITEVDGGVVRPETDLVPLCSNCHSMAHRERGRIIPLEKLRSLVGRSVAARA